MENGVNGPPTVEMELERIRREVPSMSRILTTVELEVVRLRFLEGYTQAEIGVAIGVSQQAANKHLRNALRQLRKSGGFIADIF